MMQGVILKFRFSEPTFQGALTDLKLKKLYIVHAGDATFPLSRLIQAVAVDDYSRHE
jgi:hypothetical protein